MIIQFIKLDMAKLFESQSPSLIDAGVEMVGLEEICVREI